MNNYEERTENIVRKAKRIRNRRVAWITSTAAVCIVAIVCCAVFVPFGGGNTDKYRNDPYFALIQQIDSYTSNISWKGPTFSGEVSATSPGGSLLETPGNEGSTSSAVENTPNQVAGVSEGDIVKRTQTHAFALKVCMHITGEVLSGYYYQLRVYSLAKSQSECVATMDIDSEDGMVFWDSIDFYSAEMLISPDGGTLTMFLPSKFGNVRFVSIVTVDVSDPSQPTETSRHYASGVCNEVRMVDGKLLLFAWFGIVVSDDMYDNRLNYVPAYGTADSLECLDMANIVLSEGGVSILGFNVVYLLDPSSMDCKDARAYLSTTGDVYVSQSRIYFCKLGGDATEIGDDNMAGCSTIINVLSYGDALVDEGSVAVGGQVESRYYLHENDGKLFVVASAFDERWDFVVVASSNDGTAIKYSVRQRKSETTTASLYCFDLATRKQISVVKDFAPKGEKVQAVRYDGNAAYVCTSIYNTDPVFMFDLSNPANITYKDTGTIPGYSINLLPFGEYLLGIGYGTSMNTLKVELYRETAGDVRSVDSFEMSGTFATQYKAQLVDAELGLVGLPVRPRVGSYNGTELSYLVLRFDGEYLQKYAVNLLSRTGMGEQNRVRAFVEDGWLYVVTPDNIFSYDLNLG